MIITYFKDYMDLINEGLIKTLPIEKIYNDLIYKLNIFLPRSVIGNLHIDKFDIKIINYDLISPEKLENIYDYIFNTCVNIGGYFPSKMEITNINGMFRAKKFDLEELKINQSYYADVKITFEKKYDDLELNIPNKLYHLSIKEYEDKIKRYGLSPKSKSKLTSHIDRIYVCKTIEDCEALIPQMKVFYSEEYQLNYFSLSKKKYKKDVTPIIYEIDNSSNWIKKLYLDPNYQNGYYILENILPKYLFKIN